MIRTVLVLAISLTLGGSGHARDLTQLAMTLGEVLGLEEACSISLSENKVRSFVRHNVPDDDIEFVDTMNTSARVAPYEFAKMRAAQKAAQCEQMSRLAKRLDLLN